MCIKRVRLIRWVHEKITGGLGVDKVGRGQNLYPERVQDQSLVIAIADWIAVVYGASL